MEADNNSEEALILLRRIKSICKELFKMKDRFNSVEEIFTEKRAQRMRQILIMECEKLSQFPHFQRESLDLLWRYVCYEPIVFHKKFAPQKDAQTEQLKSHISQSVSTISALLAKNPDQKFSLLIWLGDLYRYSFTLCGQDRRDFEVSTRCYRNAALSDSTSGRPYNQLALLNLEIDTFQAISLFLHSLLHQPQAETESVQKNMRLIAENEWIKSPCQNAFYNFIIVSAFEFSRSNFEDSRKELEKHLDELKVEDFRQYVKYVYCCSMAAAFAFRNQPVDEQFRYIASFTCQKLISILEETRKICAEIEDEVNFNKRRRRRKNKRRSNSSSSLNSDESDEDEDGGEEKLEEEKSDGSFELICWHSAIIVAEFVNNCSEQFGARKLSVSLKLQYQNMLKTFVDLLNDLAAEITSLLVTTPPSAELSNEKRALVDWWIGESWEDEAGLTSVLLHNIRAITSTLRSGIAFDKYFRLLSSNVSEKERQTMAGISRLHTEHVNKINEKLSKIPVYIVPDHHVMLEKLQLLEQLGQTSRQTTIVTRSVLTKLDKMKKDSANAREAIRWIQGAVTDRRVRLFHEAGNARNLFAECKTFLEEKNLLDKQTLFMSILTAEGTEAEARVASDAELAKFPVICVEKIDVFVKRIADCDEK